MEEYKKGQEIFLLLNGDQVRAVLETWVEANWECDLHVCRSRNNPGKYVVRTLNAVWAACIVKWHGAEKVTYK